MDRTEALKVLGLPQDATPSQIETATTSLVAQLGDKAQKAPTDTLRAKFQTQIARVQQAQSVLKSSATGPRKSHSTTPLSQTQIADLPHVGKTQFSNGHSTGSTPENTLSIGQKLANRYEIRELIGAGGMGAVYRAFDPNRDKEIAIKVLLPHLLNNERARERFLQEARLSSEMSHPNIVTVFDVQQEDSTCFLTMELLKGQSLREQMQQRLQAGQTYSIQETSHIAEALCDALAYAHERTVHRDIKPENIWITPEGRAKIMDFGIARLMNNTQATHTQVGVGTAYYMAPEQLQGRGSIDGRADQYAVAVMLYELLAGHVPVGRMESLSRLRKDVPRKLSDAVDKALSSRPEDRHNDMQSFKQALGQTGGSRLVMPDVPEFLNAYSGSPKSRIVTGVALLVLVTAAGWYIMNGSALKSEYIRTAGTTLAQFKSLQGIEQKYAQELREIEQKLEKNARSGSDHTLENQQLELRQEDLKLALNRYAEKLNAGPGYAELEGQIKAAEEAARTAQYGQALEDIKSVTQRLQELDNASSGTLKNAPAERDALLTHWLGGRWKTSREGDCNNADDTLHWQISGLKLGNRQDSGVTSEHILLWDISNDKQASITTWNESGTTTYLFTEGRSKVLLDGSVALYRCSES